MRFLRLMNLEIKNMNPAVTRMPPKIILSYMKNGTLCDFSPMIKSKTGVTTGIKIPVIIKINAALVFVYLHAAQIPQGRQEQNKSTASALKSEKSM